MPAKEAQPVACHEAPDSGHDIDVQFRAVPASGSGQHAGEERQPRGFHVRGIGVCPFDLAVHLEGFYKSVDYYDNSGFLYKTINTVGGGGPFTVTNTAHGTTLTQQSEAFSEVITYNRDGSARTYTRRGSYARFTVPGGGIVLLDTGIATWSEPDEDLLFARGDRTKQCTVTSRRSAPPSDSPADR